MKTIKKVPVTMKKVKSLPEKMIQGVMYISDEYQTAGHLCLCGCGVSTAVPLGKDDWTYTDNEKGLTMSPSFLQRFDCKSHYIITEGVANFV